MKKTTTTVKEIFDEEGRLVLKETTTVVEEETPKSPYTYPYQPHIWPTIGGGVTYTGGTTGNSSGQHLHWDWEGGKWKGSVGGEDN